MVIMTCLSPNRQDLDAAGLIKRAFPDRKVTNATFFTAFDSDSEDDQPHQSSQPFGNLPPPEKPTVPPAELSRLAARVGQRKTLLSQKQRLQYKMAPEDEARRKAHWETVARITKEHKEKIKKDLEQEFMALRLEVADIKLASSEDVQDMVEEFEEKAEQMKKRVEAAIALETKKLAAKQKAELAAKAEAERKAKLEKEQKEKSEREAKEKAERDAKAKQEEADRKAASASASLSGLAEYQHYMKTIEHYREHYRPALQDRAFRTRTYNLSVTIKRYLKQLQYKHHIVYERYNAILAVLSQAKNESEQTFHVVLNKAAKGFLQQARMEISSIAWSSYFYARLAVLISNSVPEFWNYLCARLYKRCPYMTPNYHDSEPKSQAELKKLLRYEYDDNEKTVFITDEKYELYQEAYIRLYAAICQLQSDPGQPPNQHGIKYAWCWLARFINVPPRAISPTLIRGFLHIAGQDLINAYPRQSRKLFLLIRDHYLPKVPEGPGVVGVVSDLTRRINDYLQTGRMEKLSEHVEAKV